MKAAIRSSILLLVVALTGAVSGVLRADVIVTREGARIVGHITKVADGKITIATDYAGDITVAQKHIVAIATYSAVAVRLTNGRRLEGRLSGANGAEQVATPKGSVRAPVAAIAAIWAAGQPDPATLSTWRIETGVDVTSKTGNHNQMGSSYSAKATLTGPTDALILSTNYYRQTTDGLKSSDQFKVGGDLTENYSDRSSWYGRDEAGFDRIKSLRLYNTAAAGSGYDFVKEHQQTITGRIGLAYRFEEYSGEGAENVRSLALDLGLSQSVKLNNAALATRFALVSNLDDFTNMHITQETDYDMPIGKSSWKIRLGVANDFNSKVALDVRKLDTTYFGQFIMNWK